MSEDLTKNNTDYNNMSEEDIIKNLNDMNEKQKLLQQKLKEHQEEKKINEFKNSSIQDYINKNGVSYKNIAHKLEEFQLIFNSKIPESDSEEYQKVKGMTCEKVYTDQLKKIKDNYNQYVKKKTGKTMEEYDELPEDLVFRGESVMQTNFFPVYYYLKPMFDNMVNIMGNQELIIIKLAEKLNILYNFIDSATKHYSSLIEEEQEETTASEETVQEEPTASEETTPEETTASEETTPEEPAASEETTPEETTQ